MAQEGGDEFFELPGRGDGPFRNVGLQPVGMGEGAARKRGIRNLQEPVGTHLLVVV